MHRFAAASLWPLVIYGAGVAVVIVGMLGLSFVAGQRHRELDADEPYKSGIAPTGTARLRLSVKYYLLAMFFVVFDLESLFIVVWAAVLREARWPGYFEALAFIAVLLASLWYLWRCGALDWQTAPRCAAPADLQPGAGESP